MDQIVPRHLQFDRFTLDLTRGCVWVGGGDVDLPPKAFDVLRFLAENAGRLVSKQELLDAVWPGVSVTDVAGPAHSGTAPIARRR
jgi:DNA-binding winged helix-turn-helix (wHTH) protein